MELKNYNFTKEFHEELINGFQTIKVKKNTVVVFEADAMKTILFVKDGLVKVYKVDVDLGREILLYYVEPNQPCMMSIIASLRGTKSRVNAMAERDSEIIMVPNHRIRTWQIKYEEWNKFILDIFMDRYMELINTLQEITFEKIECRILKKLTEIEVKNNSKDIEITHQALANTLGTTRVVVSRILKKLENEGLVRLNRGNINKI